MVKKQWLIATNGLVWMLAGANIAKIGIGAAVSAEGSVWQWSWVVLAAFSVMFFRVIDKNVKRIRAMECSKAPLYQFLSPRGYVVIVFMMSLGIFLRKCTALPESFFAYFYTGLGTALLSAGLVSLVKLLAGKYK